MMTVLQTLVTEKQPPLTSTRTQKDQYPTSPYFAVLQRVTTELQPYVHCGPHLWLL